MTRRLGLVCVLAVAALVIGVWLVHGHPASARAAVVELNVEPAAQRFSPAIDGDNGQRDCLPAAIFMALRYLAQQDGATPLSYEQVRAAFRGDTNPRRPLDPWLAPRLVPSLTQQAVTATMAIVPADSWQSWLATQLRSGAPVVAIIANWLLLSPPDHPTAEAGLWEPAAHAVLISGIHDGQIFYDDPWDGGRYGLPLADFATAWGESWLALTFQVHQGPPSPTR